MNEVYDCWLRRDNFERLKYKEEFSKYSGYIYIKENSDIITTAANELISTFKNIFGIDTIICEKIPNRPHILLCSIDFANNVFKLDRQLGPEGFSIEKKLNQNTECLMIAGKDNNGILYGVFHLIKSLCAGKCLEDTLITDAPQNGLRMINHWDNISGNIERGYSGQSIFYKDNVLAKDMSRIKDYARLLASIGINGVVINNVNVQKYETKFITDEYLPQIKDFADVFRLYGAKLFLSISFAAPIEVGGLKSADPMEEEVKNWWRDTADRIYSYIPDFGGFLVKADSEHSPGPFTYGRNHADGANLLAEALKPYGGLVIWRCFVYNCQLDWRDRTKDRAKAAYENFKPIDGQFSDNVILQIKNGPMDFQIREPISPLFGALNKTNISLEVQIAQEYTGQQKDLCYLVPMWKEVLDFDTRFAGTDSTIKKIVSGRMNNMSHSGMAAVSNIGDSTCWTGNPLAQANLFGFGRLAWNMDLTSEAIAREWIELTFGCDEEVMEAILSMLLTSRKIYEKYTVPLGIGWMVNPGDHYGPSVDGYEYSQWGTYHYADFKGLGVDRTAATGTGFTKQYSKPVYEVYENIKTCPEELLLFFHHVPYTYVLKSGKTVIQHIYDTHFEGVNEVEGLIEKWNKLEYKISSEAYKLIAHKLNLQLENAKEWRDVVNTYFYRRTGINDIHGRKIYQ